MLRLPAAHRRTVQRARLRRLFGVQGAVEGRVLRRVLQLVHVHGQRLLRMFRLRGAERGPVLCLLV